MKVLIVLAVLIHLSYGLSQSERDAVVQAHNNFRSQLANGQTAFPNNQYAQKAKNMYKMVYNPSIEAIAQTWADKCVFAHNDNRGGNGENIWGSSGNVANAAALTGAAGSWWSEFKNVGGLYYQNGNAFVNASIWDKVGHASQMGWARSTQIGCGVAHCASFPQTFVVCNYYEHGNVQGAPVYQVGNPCTANDQCTTVANSACDVSVGLCYISNGQQSTTSSSQKTSTPVQTTTPGTCQDTNEACGYWSTLGYCDTTSIYYGYMKGNCPKSCGFCPTQTTTTPTTTTTTSACKDTNEACGYWGTLGYCDATSIYYGYMKGNCPKSCTFCN